MLEIAEELLPWLQDGTRVALATVIEVVGSSPHPAASSMAVTADGRIAGAVSSGCVELAALRACRALLDGAPASVQRYGFGDAEGAAAGLACGGELDVLIHALDPAAGPALRAIAEGEGAALALALTGDPGALGAVVPHATPLQPDAGIATLDGRRLLVDLRAPAPRMVLVGATAVAAALAAAARATGRRVTVVDPRADLTRADRFPGAHRVVVGRPHELLAEMDLGAQDAVCVLGHDEDLDPLALAVALTGAGYVGALGSRATAARRRLVLASLGVDADGIARLRSPIGLALGATTAAETAVAILAEVLAHRAGTDARPLKDGDGPIRRREPAGQSTQTTARASAASFCSPPRSTSGAVLGSIPNTQTVPIR